ncbi:hypothetical protein GOZ78_15490 [Agrobacterium vitis]|uniref:Uncharacterized protein n=1 Tax=Agrobacterium vitis TaxID=373 RepID=A0ABD6GHL2_AGRVI|nr:hypothetical protein [Agrobacterium vitis]MUO78897.1 hypothetical protein [Agrobacterium vitis]MUO94460.1 hypothetical protein [Agrobacterium vitis]MUP06119.1 hypothetical protein [Agrobacterium vitis]MUZ82216.1 hypothetical protein [Agrobacterium vitis]MVA11423.1 hypothetical protein [Agrobacterium vitis]
MARFDHEDQLADIMRQFFEARDAARALRVRLETQRREMGVSVAAFYDPRSNPVYAADILRHLDLRQSQADLLQAAERKVTGPSATENDDDQNGVVASLFSQDDENLSAK